MVILNNLWYNHIKLDGQSLLGNEERKVGATYGNVTANGCPP